jgi:hypothetical protein
MPSARGCRRLRSAGASAGSGKVRVEPLADLRRAFSLLKRPLAPSSAIARKYLSLPPGTVQSSMQAAVLPMFLKRCTVLRGTKTSIPGPAFELCRPTVIS